MKRNLLYNTAYIVAVSTEYIPYFSNLFHATLTIY